MLILLAGVCITLIFRPCNKLSKEKQKADEGLTKTPPPCLIARRVLSKQQINLSIDDVESVISEPDLSTTVECSALGIDDVESDLSTTVECSAPDYVFTEVYETVETHEPLRHTAPGRLFRTSSFLLDGVSIGGGTLGSLRVNILNQVMMRETRSRFNGISCTSLNSSVGFASVENGINTIHLGDSSDTTPPSLYEMSLGDNATRSELEFSLSGGTMGTFRLGLLKGLWRSWDML